MWSKKSVDEGGGSEEKTRGDAARGGLAKVVPDAESLLAEELRRFTPNGGGRREEAGATRAEGGG